MADSFLILAQAAGGQSAVPSIVLFVGLFVIMYFVMIRPQNKQLKEHRELIAGLKKGDEIVTRGGLIGRIHVVSEREVTLEVATGVRMRVLKTYVAGRYATAGEPATAAKTEDKKEEK